MKINEIKSFGSAMPQYSRRASHGIMPKKRMKPKTRDYDMTNRNKTRKTPISDDVSEFKIVKPDPKDTMGIKRNQMPQVATKDYPEFMDYLKDNGAQFKKETVPAKSLKAVQGEFSDQGVEKALRKRKLKKASIVSSDNYIIDGHHRWVAALNTGQDVDIIRVNMPAKELLELVKNFNKTTYKDIYTEGYKLQLERGSDMDVLHITDTKTGKRTEVRGKPGYESGNYDANDKLHQLLDKIGKAANISELINGEPVGINPNHPDGKKAKKDTDTAFNEDTPLGLLKRKASHLVYKQKYASAAQKLHDILTRKHKETGGKLKHALGYYAHMLSRQTGEKLNWRELQQEYLDTFGNEYFEDVTERKLTKGEEKKKEKYVKGMKKNKDDFKKRYGKDAEAVMYATATKMAKNEDNNYGIPDGATLAQLDNIAKNAKSEKKRTRAHWLRNMRRGKNKK